jgi:glycosyltransferase involved in cell wall biosynthesis
MKSVAIVASHPVQYQAPWFRALAKTTDLVVLFAHRVGADEQARAGFGVPFEWDTPLFDGYRFEWLENVAAQPGIDRFRGCDTPGIFDRVTRGRFDAVIVNGWSLRTYWQAVRAARRTGTPVMVRGDSQLATERGMLRRAVKRVAYPRLLDWFDAFLTVGRRSEDYYRHYGISDERLFRSPHCVDNAFFAAAAAQARRSGSTLRRDAGIADTDTVFLMAGKLVDYKRPFDFLAALERARRARPDLRGLIVGDGPMRGEIEDHLRAHDTGCAMIGFLNQGGIARAYASADAVVMTSHETWGLVVNEAMACGVPAVVSDVAGCAPDLIVEGQTGFTYPYGDVDALADRMLRLAANGPDARLTAARQATELISRYSPEAAAAGVVDAMRALEHGHRGRRMDPNHVDAVS